MKFCYFHLKPRLIIQRYSQVLVSPPDIQHATNRQQSFSDIASLYNWLTFLQVTKVLRAQRQLIILPIRESKNTLVLPFTIFINKYILSLHEMIAMPFHDRNNLLNKSPLIPSPFIFVCICLSINLVPDPFCQQQRE